MKSIAKVLLTLCIACNFAYADNTTTSGQEITRIRFDGKDNHLYFETSGKWSATNCQSTYIWVKPTISGQKEILSIGLAAQMAGKKVFFYGSCGSNPEYFEAYYITLLN